MPRAGSSDGSPTVSAGGSPDGLPVLHLADGAAWVAWLEANHASANGAWLRLARKGGGETALMRPEALEVALCFGWIDGQARSEDAAFWRQRFTPRRPRSRWSQVNCAAVERLHAAGELRPSGLREMEAARHDGRWAAAYAPPRTIVVPDDLAAALETDPAARARFATLDAKNRYAILYRIEEAKRPETRRRRIETFVGMLARGELLHPKGGAA